jgi:hypothetical protein
LTHVVLLFITRPYVANVVGRPGIAWTSGFLVPGKGYGALNLYFTDGDAIEGPYNIAEDDVRPVSS